MINSELYRHIDVFIEVSESIAGNLDTGTVLDIALQAVSRALNTEAASILLYDEEHDDLIFHIVKGQKTDGLHDARLPKDEKTIGGWTAMHKQPLLIPDAYADPRFNRDFDRLTGFQTRSILSIPMIAKGRLFGVLQLLNPKNRIHFLREDLPLAETVSQLVAVALLNAKEHEARIRSERLASIGEAISGMAHCIKNILNGINSGSYILERQISIGTFQNIDQGWKTVKRNLRLLTDIVLNMLAYSKVRKPSLCLTNIRDLFSDIVALMEEQAAARQIELVIEYEKPSTEMVVLDDAAIRRCLINLVGNAMDACTDKKDARVTLKAGGESHTDEGGFFISVSDNGCGMSKETLAKLFTPFFSTKGNRGTGLGLAVTQKLIHEHNGKILADSILGQGTTFLLKFPPDSLEVSRMCYESEKS